MTALSCANSPTELSGLVRYPEKLTELSIHYGEDHENGLTLDGIEKFPNLEKLMIDSYDLKDTSALSAFSNLKEFTLRSDTLTSLVNFAGNTGMIQIKLECDRI